MVHLMITSEETKTPQVSKGLKGVLAADSSVCDIDGSVGRLLYRGYDIDDLARGSTFEETTYLLFKGELPTSAARRVFGHACVRGLSRSRCSIF